MTDYTIITLPTYTGIELTAEQQSQVHVWVTEKHGLGSLHSTLIEQLTLQLFGVVDAVYLAVVAYYCFKEMLLAEHYVAQMVYNKHVIGTPITGTDRDYVDFKLDYMSGPNHLTDTMLKRFEECKHIPIAAIRDLVEDPMQEADNTHLFMYPEDRGKNPPRPLPFATKPAVINLLKTMAVGHSCSTAIIVLDSKSTYMGHIYVWPGTEAAVGQAHTMGIRTSITNLLCRSMPNVAAKLLHGVLLWCSKHKFTTLEIINPLDIMVQISTKMGFVKTIEGTYTTITVGLARYTETPTYIEYGTAHHELFASLLATPEFEMDVKLVATMTQLDIELAREYSRYLLTYDPRSWGRIYEFDAYYVRSWLKARLGPQPV